MDVHTNSVNENGVQNVPQVLSLCMQSEPNLGSEQATNAVWSGMGTKLQLLSTKDRKSNDTTEKIEVVTHTCSCCQMVQS